MPTPPDTTAPDRPPELAVTPTVVKHFFQYRCDRQARYLMIRGSHPVPLPPKSAGRWADEGTGFEAEVVAALAEDHPVLRLDGVAGPEAAGNFLAFLRRETDDRFAYQCPLDLSDDEELRSRWNLPDGLRAGRGLADLVRADPGPVFRVIDVKHAQRATAFHRAQVAAYALFLARLLERHRIPGRVDDLGEIWHARPAAGGVEWEPAEFRLGGYAAQVEEFFRVTAPRLAAVAVTTERDESFFHLSYKCEQCRYLPHCGKSVAAEKPPAEWDTSAVPGLSQQGKRTLLQLGVRTVGEVASANLGSAAGVNWSLRQNAELVALRAAALASGRIARLPRRYTYAMPGEFDLAVVLAADNDPIDGRLAAVGCLCEWGHGPTARRELTVEPISEAGEGPERDAILKVLGAVVAALDDADRHNAAGTRPPVRAHLFVYESSEAADFRAALGRHLGDEAVRTGLLHMLRVFPPDDVPPEPEYKGAQHLPATALRAVLDELYALPVKVAHDLRSVTAALANADPPLAEPYTPEPRFARPFSSRLNIDACRDLKAGTLAPADVADDLTRRLIPSLVNA